ncbi:sortase [Jiangella anatolica]|uniref:Sortase n=2 Tax=Jiangella anatolica TaxID=2670374 RepID=A0A2W2BF75_9ACTN|nr:sortase [Jiangella anatolica]
MPSVPVVVSSGLGDALRLPGLALTIVGVLLLGFVAQLGLLSQLGHSRAQELAFDEFRVRLADGTAPLGQLNADEELYPSGTAMAVLEIPALALHEVVFEGTTSAVLQDGPGHRRDTVYPGQAGTSVVMGRQATYGGPFGGLDLLQPGEPLTVTTGQGAHTYHVTGVRREGDPQPPPLAAGEGRLTLVTAGGDPFRPDDVLRVDAELVSDPVPAPSRPYRPADLPESEQAMKGDPSGWVAVMLWAQAIAVAAAGVAWATVAWGKAQAWTVGVPLLGGLGIGLADAVAVLLPNLM